MRKIISLALCIIMASFAFTGCLPFTNSANKLTYDEAVQEMNALMKKVNVYKVSSPVLDIYSDDFTEADALSDISVFPITTKGNGEINIEIAADTELSDENAPDDWGNVVAAKFNRERFTLNGKTVSVSIRKITGGEVVTYMRAGAYSPDLYIPSHAAWGKMLDASGIHTITLTERLLGNTGGILISDKVYDKFIEKYGEANMKTVIEATLAGDLSFAYTNPYTSSTGLNMLTMILAAFDESNPLSATAAEKLLEYQRQSPPVAYTTAVLRNKAAKGIIDAMVMEEQAYILTKALSNYVYIPAGIRHDHPVFTFDYVSQEKQDAAKLFIDYCMRDENQKLGTDKGFNRHDDYAGQTPGLDGNGYLEAQALWKKNKNGGVPTVAVFIADTSGSMAGTPLAELKSSLIASSAYINSDSYVGLVSYSDDVTIHLDIKQFDDKQRAYFSGEVKGLSASGSTATYNAVLVALRMLDVAKQQIPECRPILFVLTDGEQNSGWNLGRIKTIVDGMDVPVYTIAYNYRDTGELEELSSINEAVNIRADSDNIVNELRNLFNVEG
ncbi:MAG: VWA domain-containing protein [Clostridia bacterium]|nr:VWA domain-containing protein [Clostridia bacterium]